MGHTITMTRSNEAPGAAIPSPRWREHAEEVIRQDPCIATAASMAGLAKGATLSWPRAVFVGLGLCSGPEISAAVPLDILGLLLPAERIRRSVGARELLVLVADAPEPAAFGDRRRWAAQSRRLMASLLWIRARLGLSRMSISTASVLRASSTHRRLSARLETQAPGPAMAYFRAEAADIETTRQLAGPLLKVGWTLGPGARRDEVAFDRAYRAWFHALLPTIYCKPGRSLDDDRIKAAPYIVLNPARRICLSPGERPGDKLRAARGKARSSTINGVKRHLRAIARDFCEVVGPLEGPLEARVDEMVRRVTVGTPGPLA